MSLLIKGMTMPKACYECTMYEADLYYCKAVERDIDIRGLDEKRCSFCPLAEIPSHGRIVDADILDGLLNDIAKEYPKRPLDSIGGYWIDKFRNMLKVAPTIIEAERRET